MLTEKEIQVLELRAKKLTQIDVSERLKISQAAVSHFEKNALKKISHAEEILTIARRLKLTSASVTDNAPASRSKAAKTIKNNGSRRKNQEA